jgi:6,7-dimethyl-8-ribityllumazine synthase
VKRPPEARVRGAGLRVLLLRSDFNGQIVDGLVSGAREALAELGVPEDGVELLDVPGAFELPLNAQVAASSGRFDAIVALGAVVKGETDHYEHIARECAAGLMQVARETRTPVAFGVLTVRDAAHALARSAPGPHNKGAEAARAALMAAAAVRRLRE